MRKQLEKDIQKDILDYLRYRGIFCWKQNNAGIRKPDGGYIPTGLRGVSDILGIFNGKFLAIEVKQPGNSLSTQQSDFLSMVNEKGGIGFVAYSIDDIDKHLWK